MNSSFKSEDFPDCWADDVRMTALFAPFRLKTVNPTDWDAKMKFWCDMFEKWCYNRGSFSLEEAKSAFQRKGKYPACLEMVMEKMIGDSRLVSPSSFTPYQNEGWIGWGFRQALRPASWAANSVIKAAISPKVNKETRYIHATVMMNQALAFLSAVPDDARIGTAQELQKSVSMSRPFAEGDAFLLTMNWLRSKNLATVSSDGSLYKLAPDANNRVKPLTEAEICLPKLKRAQRNLETTIDELEAACIKYRDNAKACLVKGDKSMAMSCLRKKKALESRLDKTETRLESIKTLIDTVTQTHTDAEILNAYQSGLGALKNTMKTTGLEEDSVLDTMDELKETLDSFSDIEAAISQVMGSITDSMDLEAELRELMAEDANKGDSGQGGMNTSIEDKTNEKEKTEKERVDKARAEKADKEVIVKKKETDEDEDFHAKMEKRLKNLRLVSENS